MKYHLSKNHPIFIIGSGRSGTHWIGNILSGHADIRATTERQPMFSLATNMALDPSKIPVCYKRLVLAYQWQLSQSAPRFYLDKTHPNIWLAENLKASFPQSRFIGIERNPYATIASMLVHKGVLTWQKRWREFPVPNRFLGITAELAKIYDTIPLASQCAIRWLSHHQRMCGLNSILGSSFMLVSYEELANDTEKVCHDLAGFIGLKSPIPLPDVKGESLDKWRGQLTEDEIGQIQAIVGFPPGR